MGDVLPFVDLGTNYEPIQVETGREFTCALSAEFDVKCWGRSLYGQLGQGNTTNIGDRNGTMGDNLAVIDLGADFSAIEIRSGDNHICALSMNDEVKCSKLLEHVSYIGTRLYHQILKNQKQNP